ncbi:MAG: hypothetical protein Q8N83_11025 [Ignavibacteria bacterium]|nr:hypothetical protein [Ignavibacteria bacterium]
MIKNRSDCKKKKKYDALPLTNERDINRVQHFITINIYRYKISNLVPVKDQSNSEHQSRTMRLTALCDSSNLPFKQNKISNLIKA